MTDVRKYFTTAGALAVLAVSTAMAQQAPTTAPQTTQPNGATTPQPPRNTSDVPPEPEPRDEGVKPETARDTTPVKPETARDTTPASPETARDISDTAPETARDISNTSPETATDISNTAPETARDIRESRLEAAGNTRVATAEASSAASVVTSETDRESGVVERVTGREDASAPDNGSPPAPNAVRSVAQLQQDDRSGCWVKLFDAPNFTGADVTLVGAASMRALDGTFRSIEVGPAATVTTYRIENFGGPIQHLVPGLKVAENNEAFASLRISCPNVSSRTTPSRG